MWVFGGAGILFYYLAGFPLSPFICCTFCYLIVFNSCSTFHIFQTKRVPYSRQTTYTKYPDGVVNLAFDANSGHQKEEAAQQKGSSGSGSGTLPRRIEEEPKKTVDEGAGKRPDPGKDKETNEDQMRKKYV